MPNPWPPKPYDDAQRQIAEWAAWYVGDATKLSRTYNDKPRTRPTQWRGGLIGAASRFFWGRPQREDRPRRRLHVPLPAELATASADLLFAEPPRITVEADAAQERLDTIINNPLVHASLLESAEITAALGGGYLRVVWDADVEQHAMLDAVDADAAIPEWKWKRLAAVTFWSVVEQRDRTVLRHLERHEPGRIVHTLHEGTDDDLGQPVPLTEHSATEQYAEIVGEDSAIATGTQRLTVAYVPNMRPNREWRHESTLAPLGRSDFAGVEPLFDALDEVYSSWMRDIDLGKARLIAPSGYLSTQGPGQGATFDTDQEVWTEVNALAGRDSGPQITQSQFAIRMQEHRDTANGLVQEILRAAGYSPATFGDQDGGAATTATEIAARERISERTRDKKIRYWKAALGHIAGALLDVDNYVFPGQGAPLGDEQPEVTFPDRGQPDPQALAQTANMLNQAEAASTETLVRMVHPEWEDDQVNREVERINGERGAAQPDPDATLRSVANGE